METDGLLAPLLDRLLTGGIRAALLDLERYRAAAAHLPDDAPERVAIGIAEGWEFLAADPGGAVEKLGGWVTRLDTARSAPRSALALALLGLGTGRALLAEPVSAAPPLERALLLVSDRWVHAHAERFLALTLESREAFAEAAARYGSAALAYRELGDAFGEGSAEYGAGVCWLRLGQVDEAERVVRAAIARLQGLGTTRWLSPLLLTLASIVVSRDPDEATALVRRARDLAGTEPGALAEVAVGFATVALATGDARAALDALASCGTGIALLARDVAVLRAAAWSQLGEPAQARAALPAADASRLGDLERLTVLAAIAAAEGDLPGVDRALAEVEHGLGRVRRDQRAVLALQTCAASLAGDPDRAALAWHLAGRAGLAVAPLVAALTALRARGARVPVGPFSVGDLLGVGGMGQVWRGTHRESGRDVAVKVLRVGQNRDRAVLDALFAAEVAAVARLDHLNVVRTLAFVHLDAGAAAMLDQSVGSPCLVMEYVEGGTLDAHAEGWRWDDVREVVVALLDALAHAHARGVLHLDVKPENVLLERSDGRWSPRLTDFGLAGMGAQEGGSAFGTPAYLPPEQARGRLAELGPWSDLYALGGLVWRVVTGATPFHGSDPVALLLAQCVAPVPRFAPRMAVPVGLEGWLRTLLAKAPGDRFACAADAGFALSKLGSASRRPETAAAGHRDDSETLVADGFDIAADFVGTARSAELPDEEAAPLEIAPLPSDWRSARRSPPVGFLTGLGEGLLTARVAPLIGRDAEMQRLWEAIREIRAGGPGSLWLVVGAPGVGRSHLVASLAERCHATGAADILRLSPEERTVPPGRPGARPRLVLLDDLDRAPCEPALLDEWVAGGAVVVATACRVPDGWGGGLLPLAPLSTLEIQHLLDHLLPLERLTGRRLAAQSDGNPAFAVALLTWLVRTDALFSGREGYELRPGAAADWPTDLLALASARLEELAPMGTSRRAQWEIAALLGATVDVAEWEAACRCAGLPVDGLADLLTPPVFSGVRFASAPLREALVAGAAGAGRARAWHEACAETLGGRGTEGRRGRHLLAAGRPGEAVPLLRVAAADAVNSARVDEARALLASWFAAADAAAIPERHPLRAEIRVVMSHLAAHTGEDPVAWLREALGWVEGTGSEQEVRLNYSLGGALRLAGDYAGARAPLERVVALEGGRTEMKGLALLTLAMVLFDSDEDGTEAALAAREILAERGSSALARSEIATARGLVNRGQFEAALPHLERARDGARQAGWRMVEADALWWMQVVAKHRGDGAAAVAFARAAASALEGTGSEMALEFELRLALVLAEHGARTEALEIVERARTRFVSRMGPKGVALLARVERELAG